MDYNARKLEGVTASTISAGLIHTAGAANTFATTVQSEGMINGKWVTTPLGITTGGTTPTTDAATGAAFVALTDNQATVIVWGQTATGTIQLCQGSIENTQVGAATVAGDFIRAPQFPNLPDNFCPMAYQLIRTAPDASAFTIGTSNWNATGITVSTAQNIAVLPDRLQTS